ncbi:hypothetical protein ACFWIA_11590 [Streptomyces sp. NPDC127068]|uniref:hypothetical protein n=1 Tax=Streptomyces sp. NPDC127068 TaxID=3347127 RepID=UPI00364D45FE
MSTTEDQGSPLRCELTTDDFTALATLHSGGRRRVTVTGHLSCPSTGFTLRLEPGNPGTPPQPNELVLRIVEEEPDGSVLPVLTETEASGYFEVTPEVDTVVIRNLDLRVPVKDA